MTGQQAQPAPSPEEMRHLALRIAVLAVEADDAAQRYQLARKVAGERFARARKLGLPQQVVMLPGGIEAGKLVLKAGARTVTVNEDTLLALIAAGTPSETEDCISGSAAADPRTVELLAEHAPDLVELQLRPGALSDPRTLKILAEYAPDLVELRIRREGRDRLQKYLMKHGGCVPDPAGGESLVKVATITQHDPTGDFTWHGMTEAMPLVREALESGRLVITANGDVAETLAGEVVAPEGIEGSTAA